MLSTAGAAFRQLCRLERYRSAAVDCQTDGGLLLTARIFHPIVGWADFGALFPFSRHRSSGRSNNDQQPSKAKLASLRRPGAPRCHRGRRRLRSCHCCCNNYSNSRRCRMSLLQSAGYLVTICSSTRVGGYLSLQRPLWPRRTCRLRLMIGTLQCWKKVLAPKLLATWRVPHSADQPDLQIWHCRVCGPFTTGKWSRLKRRTVDTGVCIASCRIELGSNVPKSKSCRHNAAWRTR